jgi:hypothetical protein
MVSFGVFGCPPGGREVEALGLVSLGAARWGGKVQTIRVGRFFERANRPMGGRRPEITEGGSTSLPHRTFEIGSCLKHKSLLEAWEFWS